MSEQQQMKYHKPTETGSQYSTQEAVDEAAEATVAQKAARKAGELAVEATDDLLDEIDAILEENGEEMAINFRQKGGE